MIEWLRRSNSFEQEFSGGVVRGGQGESSELEGVGRPLVLEVNSMLFRFGLMARIGFFTTKDINKRGWQEHETLSIMRVV